MNTLHRIVVGSAALLVLAYLAAPQAQAGKAKVSKATYDEVKVGAKYDEIEKMLGRGGRAGSKDVPKLADPAEEKVLADALKTSRPNLLFMWNSGGDRLVIGLQTADTGDVIVFKGYFWKDKGTQKGIFAAGK